MEILCVCVCELGSWLTLQIHFANFALKRYCIMWKSILRQHTEALRCFNLHFLGIKYYFSRQLVVLKGSLPELSLIFKIYFKINSSLLTAGCVL